MEEMLITVYKIYFFCFTILCFIMSGRDDNYNMCPIKKLINKKKKAINQCLLINNKNKKGGVLIYK
jgi:hypothetical protein